MDPLGSFTLLLLLRSALLDQFPSPKAIEETLEAAGISDQGKGQKLLLAQYLYSMMDDILRDMGSWFDDTFVDPSSGKLRAADVIFKDGDTISLESLVAGLYRGTKQYLRGLNAPREKISWPQTFGVPRCQRLGQRGLLAAIQYFLDRAERDPALCRALLAHLDQWFGDASTRNCAIKVRALARACLRHLLGAADITAQAADVLMGQGSEALHAGAGDDILQEAGWFSLDCPNWIEDYFGPSGVNSGAARGLHQPAVPTQDNEPWSPFDTARDLVRDGNASLVLDSLGPLAVDMVEGEDATDAVRDLEMQAAQF